MRLAGCAPIGCVRPASFQLAMFGHAGAVLEDFHVAPEILRISTRQNAARVDRLRAFRTDFDAASLRIAWRRQRAQGERDCKRSQPFLQSDHDESPFLDGTCPSSRHLLPCRRSRLLGFAAKRLAFKELMCPMRASSLAGRKRQNSTSPGNPD